MPLQRQQISGWFQRLVQVDHQVNVTHGIISPGIHLHDSDMVKLNNELRSIAHLCFYFQRSAMRFHYIMSQA